VRVRHTLPITFALKLPAMDRQAGVPELRQGAAPIVPPEADRNATVRADVSVVFPWSMCPIVPTFTCGLVRSNFSLPITLLRYQADLKVRLYVLVEAGL